MVKHWLWLFLFWCSPLMAQVAVESAINQNQGVANRKIEGIITITHAAKEKINSDSFLLEGKPLAVKAKNEKKFSNDTVVSNYSFELDPKEKGLYELPPISVEVDGKKYQSISTTYEVKASAAEKPEITPANRDSIVFKLEAFVDGPSPLYPGQRAKLMYRISYNRSIDLTESKFPLIHTTEFKKIGDEQVKDYQAGSLTIQEIFQEIEASKPGTYHYPASSIEGYAYQTKFGQKFYVPGKLQAEAPPVEVIVADFPKQEQPNSFTGSLGTISGELKMLTPASLKLGDKIALELVVSGPTNLSEIVLPDLKCQPGFSGFFHLSDLPPAGETKQGTKIFPIDLRPISRFVKEVPSIELSAFDPIKKQYVIWHSKPIPLEVSIPPLEENVFVAQPKLVDFVALYSEVVKRANPELPALTYPSAVEVSIDDLTNSWVRTPLVLWLLPLLGIALLWQAFRQRHKEEIVVRTQKTSEQFLHEAFRQRRVENSISLLQRAFDLRLQEKGYDTDVEAPEGVPERIRQFLADLDSFRYGLAKQFDRAKIKEEAQELFNKI